jgi:peptide deformylase
MFKPKLTVADTIVTDLKFLRQASMPTTKSEVEKRGIVKAIKYIITHRRSWVPGYGLAAVQIGMPLRAAWYWLPQPHSSPKEVTLINPEIVEQSECIICPKEGCLSLPHQLMDTIRYRKIVYKNDGQIYTATGTEAQIIQHEIDHMNGVLILERVFKQLPGRNDPCYCGSGRKFKKCCLSRQ